MEQTTAIDHAISKLALNRSFANYQIQADDPLRELTGMLDSHSESLRQRIERIKDAIPQAVTQSLDLAGKKLETQFELVNKPLLETLAVQQGHLGAVRQQLASLEKRFITTGHVAAPTSTWQTWLLIGCSFTILGLAGFNTLTNAWAITPSGTLAKQILDRNPKLADNCRSLTTRELKDLGANSKARKICSVLL